MVRGLRCAGWIWKPPDVLVAGGEKVKGDGGRDDDGEVVAVEASVEADEEDVEERIIGWW